jgi:hypothetical protein
MGPYGGGRWASSANSTEWACHQYLHQQVTQEAYEVSCCQKCCGYPGIGHCTLVLRSVLIVAGGGPHSYLGEAGGRGGPHLAPQESPAVCRSAVPAPPAMWQHDSPWPQIAQPLQQSF